LPIPADRNTSIIPTTKNISSRSLSTLCNFAPASPASSSTSLLVVVIILASEISRLKPRKDLAVLTTLLVGLLTGEPKSSYGGVAGKSEPAFSRLTRVGHKQSLFVCLFGCLLFMNTNKQSVYISQTTNQTSLFVHYS
jgi:hypothetical protein